MLLRKLWSISLMQVRKAAGRILLLASSWVSSPHEAPSVRLACLSRSLSQGDWQNGNKGLEYWIIAGGWTEADTVGEMLNCHAITVRWGHALLYDGCSVAHLTLTKLRPGTSVFVVTQSS